MVKPLARQTRTRPAESEPREEFRIADIPIINGEAPEAIAALGVRDNRLHLLRQVALFGACLIKTRVRHAEFIEKCADVIRINRVQHKFIHREGFRILLLALQIEAEVIGDKPEVTTQIEALALDGVLNFADAMTAPALGRGKELIVLSPRVQCAEPRGVRTKEEELRDWLFMGIKPKVGRTKYCDTIDDVGICREPVLHEGPHAKFQRKCEICRIFAHYVLALHKLPEPREIFLVHITL